MRRKTREAALVLSAALLSGALSAGATRAQEAAALSAGYDCVIEPKRVVELGSAEDGVVGEILVDRGDIVEAGAIVARLDFELQVLTVERARVQAERNVEVRSSQARLAYRRREAARARQLHDKSIVSTKLLDEAKIEQQLAEYGVTAAELDRRMAEVELRVAEARLERRTIRSTVTGVVVEVTKSPGELTHDQAPVMTIAQIDPLSVEVFIPIERFGTVTTGMEAEVLLGTPLDGVYKARVDVVDRVLDAASGTFGVRLELPNPEYRLPAGLKCNARFPTRKARSDGAATPAEDFATASPPAIEELPDVAGPDRDGGPDVAEPAPAATDPAWNNKALIYVIQTKLVDAGYDPGPPDGVLGDKTRAAIRDYQQVNGLDVTGNPSLELFNALRERESSR
ncbi:MAG: efflux RND transporter periplasmic adaptor subunit [Alphaproteobacteria bacterium]|nr:efflux RND transporter periplasmic adaptor subunit [Alphaproteobacteria bacterium]